jgi:hypothetical protein
MGLGVCLMGLWRVVLAAAADGRLGAASVLGGTRWDGRTGPPPAPLNHVGCQFGPWDYQLDDGCRHYAEG